jgi:hypothetical protein
VLRERVVNGLFTLKLGQNYPGKGLPITASWPFLPGNSHQVLTAYKRASLKFLQKEGKNNEKN